MKLALMVLSLLVVCGCTGDVDSRAADVKKTTDVARPYAGSTGKPRLKVAVAAMISPHDTALYYKEIMEYLGNRLGQEVELVQRKTYGEINELLAKGEIDVAFICSGPYAIGRDVHGFKLLATPEVNGSHSYQSYLIVNKNSPSNDLEDLRGKTFAFTDPDSNTGTLVPVSWLNKLGETPETFFGRTFYTYSHDKSITEVAEGTADGACVDSLIWEFYNRKDPAMTDRTRVIQKSELYGIPPLVASKNVTTAAKVRIRRVLFSMHKNEAGRRILDRLMIERFIEPLDEWYESIREMSRKPKPAAPKTGISSGEKP